METTYWILTQTKGFFRFMFKTSVPIFRLNREHESADRRTHIQRWHCPTCNAIL